MNYTIFEDYITLQSLLKDLRIISSGGAVKAFLATTEVLVNGELENRRGKKLRVGDQIAIPSQGLTITIQEPSQAERQAHREEVAEKERVAALVKKLNQSENTRKKRTPHQAKKAVRFPGR